MAETEDKETLARAQLPYRAEYCKTSRASCKKCSESMEKGSLKLANMTKSRFHDGYDASFYHVPCFFQIKRPNSVAEILHFEILKFEDQKMLEKAIETKGLSVLGSAVPQADSSQSKNGSKRKKKKDKDEETDSGAGLLVNYNDFCIEYAKSGRATCITCEQKIEKDSVRIGKLDYEAETAWRGGPIARWHHVDCFAKSQEKLGFYGSVDKIKDFKELEKEDRKMVMKKVKPIEPKPQETKEDSAKKVKTEDSEALRKEEKLLKKQSDRYFKLREFVSTMKYKDIEFMLKFMDQKYSFKSTTLLVDHATDVLLFGPLEACPVCKKKNGLVLRHSGYICTNEKNELEPCTYETRDPKRGFPDLPDEIFEAYPFFQDNFTFKVGRKRIFPSKFVKAVEQKEAENNNLVQEGAPLDGLSFGVISWSSIKHDRVKVEKKVSLLGGKVRSSLDSQIFVILTSSEELNKNTPKVEVAKALEIPFANADFLFSINTKNDVVRELKKCLIGDCHCDLEERFQRMLNKPEVETKDKIKTETEAKEK